MNNVEIVQVLDQLEIDLENAVAFAAEFDAAGAVAHFVRFAEDLLNESTDLVAHGEFNPYSQDQSAAEWQTLIVLPHVFGWIRERALETFRQEQRK